LRVHPVGVVIKKGRYPDQIEHEPLDRLIAERAARRHGYVTRQQLLDLGVGASAIKRRLRAGRLIRVHAGVYAVGHVPTTPVARAAAAVLACGESAVLSHGSAAALWGFQKRWPEPIEVTTPTHHRRPGIRVHRCGTLTRRDLTTHRGIRVTSPARTVRDIAPSLSDQALTRAVNDGLVGPYLRRAELAELLTRLPCERLAAQLSGPEITRSELEDAFRRFARRHGLPAPRCNARVAGREVDVLFAEAGLIVELDSWRFHGTRAAFESDRERDAQMLAAGLSTVRVTWERLREAPEREAARLKGILAARGELLRSSQTRVG
jgi:very-short-patch-repair endonuclease